MRNENRQYFYTMSKRPPPPLHFPKPFANHRAENNSRSATHSATQPTASNSLRPEPAVHPPQVPNDPPQRPAPHTSLQSSAPPPVRRSTRPPVAAPAPAPIHSYSSSPPHPHSRLPPSGSVSQPPSFPVPLVPGGYGVPSNPSCLVPPPSLPMAGRAMTTYTLNTQAVGYQNVAAPDVSHQQSATVDRSRRDDGSSSFGNQGPGQSPATTGNLNDHERAKGRLSLPFALGGRGRSSRAEEQLPKPDLPCKLCQDLTSPDEHARLGGFCSERHKWEWDSRQNQNQNQQN